MTRSLLVAAAVIALSVGACSQPAQDQSAATSAEQAATPDANPAMTIPTPANETLATDFAPKAAASDMFEIAAAKIAQTRATSPAVKTFAKTMITAHTKSTDALKKAVASGAPTVTLPAEMPAELKAKLDDLQKADAKDFDKKYMDGQVDAHQAALDTLQRYAEGGDVADIKSFASTTAPVVQQHLDMAKQVRDALAQG